MNRAIYIKWSDEFDIDHIIKSTNPDFIAGLINLLMEFNFKISISVE